MGEGEGFPKSPASHGYRTASDGYQSDSDRYRDASDGYRSEFENRGSEGREPSQPHWARLGFSSFEEFIGGLKAQQTLYPNFMGTAVRESLPDPEIVGGEAGHLGSPSPRPDSRNRQVGIRLTEKDFGLLATASGMYGVAPSTMARMLVRRGARAVVEREGVVGPEA